MALLADADRAAVNADFQRTEAGAFGALLKADLRAAVNAIDQWAHDNAVAFNAAIPQPARAQLTATQKARLFAAILLKRYQKGA